MYVYNIYIYITFTFTGGSLKTYIHTYHIYISSTMVPGSPWRGIPLLPYERTGPCKADPGVINQARKLMELSLMMGNKKLIIYQY